MTEPNKDQAETAVARRSIIILRFGYIVSLSAIASVCFYFYMEQVSRNQAIQQIGELSRMFAEFDNSLRGLADHADRLAKRNEAFANSTDPRLDGVTLMQKKKILANLPVDPEIISAVSSLRFRMEKTRWELKYLREAWGEAPGELIRKIQARSRYMTNTDPFLHHAQMLAPDRLDAARTTKDIYWTGREIEALYVGIIQPSNLYVQEEFRQYLAELSLSQGALLQRYLLATIGLLLLLGLGVFVPIDFIICRMITKLQGKTREIDAALTKAKAADRAKSEFLATMSHEIRTPMNGVLGMAELLTRTDLDTRQRTFTDVILKSGNALLEIINDILDFSKIDAGQLVLSPKPFNLVDTAEDIATLMSSRVVEKDIELIVRIAPGLPDKLIGDPGRIRQIMTNLAGNAVKFTDHGHVMVEITWRVVETPGSGNGAAERLAISIAVRDTGIGIPAEKLETIFDKFSQVDSSSTRKHEGTGLGLAIATRLVDLMGGRIKVESTEGEGSSFSFTVEMEVYGEPGVAVSPAAGELSGRRVLVVDDNAINRMILTEQIRDWGFDCVAVEAGEISLDLLRHARSSLGIGIDLVVLDFQMPGMSGADVARVIRSEPLIADTPILVLSSIDQADQLEALNDLDIFAQLTKPVRTAQLRKTVNAALRLPKQPAELAPAQSPLQSALPALPATVVDDFPPRPQQVSLADDPIGGEAEAAAARPDPLILVAEDNKVNQIVFQQSLDGMGLAHRLATDGRQAVRLWQELRPTLVLMDVSMPELNGLEATAEIRAIEAREGLAPTPIIAVTAHALKGDEDRCLAAGVDDYLSKPISPEKLGAMIERWLPTVRIETEVA